jgi:hypothetical protein
MKKIILAAILLILTITCLASTGRAETSFSYSTGSPLWSYVAQGSGTVSPTDGWVFNLSASPDRSRIVIDMVKNVPGEEYQYWNLDMKNSNNTPLLEGSYLATRFPFQDPGMTGFVWGGNHRGNNTLTATIDILEINYTAGSGDVPTSLAMDFIQFEETWGDLSPSFETNKWASGSLRINSSIAPNVVPEPKVMELIIIGWLILAALIQSFRYVFSKVRI